MKMISLNWYAKVFIALFLFGFLINQGEMILIAAFGNGFLPFSMIPIAVLGLLFASIICLKNRQGYVAKTDIFFFLFASLLFVYGLLNGNLLNNALLEGSIFIVFICCLILGRYERFFSDVTPLIIFTHTVACCLCLIATRYTRIYLMEIDFLPEEGARATYQLAYDLWMLTDLWPILLLYVIREKINALWILSLLGISVFFVFSIYFEKRAPTARIVLSILALMVLVFPKEQIFRSLGLFLISGIAIYIFFGEFVTSTINRFSFGEQSRINEAWEILRSFDVKDVFIGRGLGGWFYFPGMEHFYVSNVVSVDNEIGRTVAHVGAVVPMIKGGLLLSGSLFFYFFLHVLRGLRSNSAEKKACAILVGIWIMFRFVEGAPTTGNIFEAFSIFTMLGLLTRGSILRRTKE